MRRAFLALRQRDHRQSDIDFMKSADPAFIAFLLIEQSIKKT